MTAKPRDAAKPGDLVAPLHCPCCHTEFHVRVSHVPEQPLRCGPEDIRKWLSSRSIGEVEYTHLMAVLEACGGHREKAAKILGIGARTVYRKLRQLEE